jgi:beta-galactosidase
MPLPNDDPETTGVGRLPGRALLPGYDSVADLDAGERHDVLDLTGQWTFEWMRGLRDVDLDAAGRRGATGTATIAVPGVWQRQGYGVPMYLANRFPPALGTRADRIPDIDPDANEAGVYTRSFHVPSSFDGRRVTVVLEGAKAGAGVWVNENYVGYTVGSFEVAEFDVTDHLCAGENTITIVVLRYTAGSYLEGQDMWYASGLLRPVYLLASPSVAIDDVWVRPALDATYRHGTLRSTVTVANRTAQPVSALLELLLSDPGSSERRTVASLPVDVPAQSRRDAVATVEVPDALTWTAETPNLYRLTAVLRVGGQERHVTTVHTGVRVVEIRDGVLQLNGRPITLLGVNRHDIDPDHLWAVPEHRYREDLEIAKRLNINAIRTSHYPNPQVFYDVCDELGLYVMDEADVESHGVRRKNVPGDNPRWQAACVDRMRRMVLADRNHPSIVMWSLGNEAGRAGRGGGAFLRMKKAALALDDTRPFHYEGDHDPAISDVVSRMYATAAQLDTLGRGAALSFGPMTAISNRLLTDDKDVTVEMLAGRPVMQCEYAHAMQNSLGNFAEHVDVFFAHPSVAGGFVWDFVDQTQRVRDPHERWLYGGDFGDTPHHATFLVNGILAADRRPHPSAQEVWWGYRPVAVTPIDARAGRYRVHNRWSFLDLSSLEAVVTVRVDGAVRVERVLPAPDVAPGTCTEWQVDEARPPSGVDGEVVVRIGWRMREPTRWASAGTEVAFDETVLEPRRRRAPPRHPAHRFPAIATTRSGHVVTVSTSAGQVTVDCRRGWVTGWSVDGRGVLLSPLRPTYWRAPTDNERGLANAQAWLAPLVTDPWWRHPLVRVVRRQERIDDTGWQLTLLLRSPVMRWALLQYRVTPDGVLHVMHRVMPRREMVRLGMTTELGTVESVRWYGKGPHETYVDRSHGAWTAIHEAHLDDLVHDYVRPQENGNRTGVRWVELHGSWGTLRADDATGSPMEFTAWPYRQSDLVAAEHIGELVRRDTVTLTLGRQRGVGGDKPGAAALLAASRMPAGVEHTVAFSLRVSEPLTGANRIDPAGLWSRQHRSRA